MGATAGAAAGGAVAVVNPALGAAAKKSTEQLVAEFLPAQQEALDELLERTRGIERLLGDIRADIQTLLDAPWQTALLHMADAARHPANAQNDIQLARNALYQAWGSANAGAKRALIAQQLSVVYALLGAPEDSRAWLFASYPEALNGVGESVASVVDSLRQLPQVKVGRKARQPGAEVPAGTLRVEYYDERWFVTHEPLLTALAALAESRLDAFKLCLSCALTGMPAPWERPGGWALRGRLAEPHTSPWECVGLSGVDDLPHYTVYAEPGSMTKAAVLLNDTGSWSFCLEEPPCGPPFQAFISGSSVDLGRWRQDQAIPMRNWPAESYTDDGTSYAVGARFWSTVAVADYWRAEPVQYK